MPEPQPRLLPDPAASATESLPSTPGGTNAAAAAAAAAAILAQAEGLTVKGEKSRYTPLFFRHALCWG